MTRDAAAPDSDDLVGTWHLARWCVEYPDGRTTHPYGDDAEGLLIYAADGWMSAAMWRRLRTPLSAPNPRDADLESSARVLTEYLGYAGRWHLSAGHGSGGAAIIEHRVTSAVNPVLIGTTQLREATLRQGELSLLARERDASGAARLHRIHWTRTPSSTASSAPASA